MNDEPIDCICYQDARGKCRTLLALRSELTKSIESIEGKGGSVTMVNGQWRNIKKTK